ncbi:hypothetical protein [Achromobacter xylosoxidans]|uniref:hypothetical protein n=1 Tax=Alcaligenes xylosoxydans xylosoxydans TaxID=85698 RepID=UPI000A495F60|nr:hypothetical protein [Achromobacter xylosoxidans]MCH4576041.1 hypothetical protein [Achromobacter xylosoxidans]MDD7988997.1 hypothetical protein [Achromobacter xylosoxidans]NEV05078.1 hypothetical protein [Achromobacter xylosoxidans]
MALIRKPVVGATDIQAAPAITAPIETVRQMLASMQASLDLAVMRLAEYEKVHRRAG